jgi:hypothetical protein
MLASCKPPPLQWATYRKKLARKTAEVVEIALKGFPVFGIVTFVVGFWVVWVQNWALKFYGSRYKDMQITLV